MGDAPRMTAIGVPPGATVERLEPFGAIVRAAPGTAIDAFDGEWLASMAETHRVLVLRGVVGVERHRLAAAARRLGPLLPWEFGAVNELKVVPKTENYLYTDRAVPLHWDGAFLGLPPRFLFFHCLEAPAAGAHGETVFVDTTKVWARATETQRARWRFWTFRYATAKKVHYGGTFDAALVQHHPRTGEVVLRFAEPVDDLNPVTVSAPELGPTEAADALIELQRVLTDPAVTLLHRWEDGDYVIADNLSLLHGRRAFQAANRRHIRRVNVLLPERDRFAWVWDAIRIRRPEFLVAEVPIALIPALLVAPDGGLVTWASAEIAAILLLLFHYGDMVNCHADRELDLTYKTRTAEAVLGLGAANVAAQIVATAGLALALVVDLAARTGRWWAVPWVAAGLILGWQYSRGPLRLKSKGILQIPALMAAIFVGPMLLVPLAWVDLPPIGLVGFTLAYAAMQEGIILVNTAEDLREDRAFGLYTSAEMLGPLGSVAVAAAMVALGGGVVFAELIGLVPLVVLVPFVLGWGWALGGLVRLAGKVRGAADRALAVREGAKWMPAWITATAWGALVAVAWARGWGS
jgi:alpha-ketoglutarate-dependent taurine dioxygenase/1,4-dihydroxy-2-naphthoate octaprenyltransferase